MTLHAHLYCAELATDAYHYVGLVLSNLGLHLIDPCISFTMSENNCLLVFDLAQDRLAGVFLLSQLATCSIVYRSLRASAVRPTSRLALSGAVFTVTRR
jgi:hypothetical protein